MSQQAATRKPNQTKMWGRFVVSPPIWTAFLHRLISIRLGRRHCNETKDQHKIHIVFNLVCFAIRWKLGLEMASLAAAAYDTTSHDMTNHGCNILNNAVAPATPSRWRAFGRFLDLCVALHVDCFHMFSCSGEGRKIPCKLAVDDIAFPLPRIWSFSFPNARSSTLTGVSRKGQLLL